MKQDLLKNCCIREHYGPFLLPVEGCAKPHMLPNYITVASLAGASLFLKFCHASVWLPVACCMEETLT